MKRAGISLFLLALIVSLSPGVSYGAEGYVYATTNMTWAEFYAGETGETSADLLSAGLDAISTPTTHGLARFPLLMGESGDNGTTITGLKAVQVRMTQDVYDSLSDNSRYTVSTSEFDEYKDVNADGSFGAMVSTSADATALGASVSLTTGSSARWGHYVFSVSSADIPIGSANRYCDYYLGALLETSDGKIYGMRHNNNLWFNAKDLAISTAEFVEVHGVSRSYEYTSDMEGKTITKITYMLKNLPDEIISCDVFLKLKTSASVYPVYEDGYYAVMAVENVEIPLAFSNVPSSADYSLSGVTFGTGRGRRAVTGCTISDDDVLTIAGTVSEGTYTATFSTETYADISATIRVFTADATAKVISADKNDAGLMFLLTPAGVSDATDAVLTAQNFVNATDYTAIADNSTAVFTGGANQIADSGFSLDVRLSGVPSGKRGILGFSKGLQITPAKIGANDFSAMSAKILALPDVAYGWRVPTESQLRDMGLIVVGIYPDGVSRDITGYISSGIRADDGAITFTYGTVLIDREFLAAPGEEGKVYELSEEGEGTMSDGAFDGRLSATWYVRTPGGASGGDGTDSQDITPTPASDDTRPTPGTDSGDRTPGAGSSTVTPIKPAIPLTDSKKADITQALSRLSAKVSGSTEVSELPSTAIKGTQTVTSSDTAVYLPVIEVSESKVYVFGVSLDKFAAGSPIYWHSNAQDITTGEFLDAADEQEAVIFMNDSGAEVNTVPVNKHVNVAAYFETGRTYYPAITTESQAETVIGVGSTSGGCSAGVSAAIILGLAFILTHRKR